VLLYITAKKDILPFQQRHPEIDVEHWTIIRTKVMNLQLGAKKRVTKRMTELMNDSG
jgi:hypothetical protein